MRRSIVVALVYGLVCVSHPAFAQDIKWADIFLTPNGDPSIVGGFLGGDGYTQSGRNDWIDWSIGDKRPFSSSVTDDIIFSTNIGDFLKASDWVERLRITKHGDVGIGTTDPSVKLQVEGAENTGIDVITGIPFSGGIQLRSSVNSMAGAQIGTVTNHQLNLFTGNLNRMTIASGGNIGIGTTTPTERLDVAGIVHANTFVETSDARLKVNISPLTNVLEKLAKIRGVSFEWNEASEALGHSPGQRDIGVIAQEIEAVFPELITSEGSEGYKAVAYSRLMSVLIEAFKELKAEKNADIAALKADNAALEARLVALEYAVGTRGTPAQSSSFSLPAVWILFVGLILAGLVGGLRWRKQGA